MRPALAIAGARVAIGVLAFTSPRTSARLFRLDWEENPQLGYATRLFASREVVAGAAVLLSQGEVRRHLVLAGAAIDAADAASAVIAGRERQLDSASSVLLTVPGVLAAAVGYAAARRR